ncbi:mechanosensitive ion channel family protein [Roseimaritima sediminicola]|uniref:mechanosensitive ion channel family protein n=1 Tax=Roseimaritima sediminicola TaxID=2662066 RepID=UPI001298286C|nr:mechanosensitive ion channel domain-containing protein [Roseimaritima sediminicola]
MFACPRLLFVASFCFSVAGVATAQSIPSTSQSEPAGGRPQSTQVDFFTLLESGGDAFLGWFEQEQDEPTVDAPKWNSTESPRHTVLTFVEAMNHVAQGRREPLDRALRTFADQDLEDAEQTAFDLLHVFDRLPELSPGTIPGPDHVRHANIRRYELFPRGIDHRWAYQALSAPPKGSIVLIQQNGRWEFDAATLRGASDLLESVQSIPPRPRIDQKGQLFASVMEPTFSETSFLDWLWFCLFGAAGIAIAYGAYKAILRLKRKRARGGDVMIGSMLDGLLWPTMVIAVTLGFAIGSTRLNFHPGLSGLRWNCIEVAFVVAGVMVVVALLELLVLGMRRSLFDNEDPYAQMVSLVIRRSLRILAGAILLLFVFQNIFQWNITAMLGGLGILALALSLAAKDAVKNLFGAATIFANRPFINGDWVRFDGELGQVDDVSLQVTKIRLLSGDVMWVPNMKFIDETVENLSMRKYLRRVMDIAITYDTPAEKVEEAMDILKDILTSDAVAGDGNCDLDEHPPQVWFDKFGSHYLNLRADYWYLMDADENKIQRDSQRGWFSYLDHATIVNHEVLRRFNRAGIDFAFPTQTIKLERANQD